MYLLDTNVIWELMRREPAAVVVDWVDRQPADDLFLTAITLAEILHGIARLADGRRKSTLAEQLEAMVSDDFEHRVAAFDEPGDSIQITWKITAESEHGDKPCLVAEWLVRYYPG